VTSIRYQSRACLEIKRGLVLPTRSPPMPRRRGAHNSNMPINRSNPLVASRHQQLALDELLDGKDYTILASQADGSSAVLDGFGGIFYLPHINIPSHRT
jgi:hypothetical protein